MQHSTQQNSEPLDEIEEQGWLDHMHMVMVNYPHKLRGDGQEGEE